MALDEMILDLQLMCQNAQIYNAPNSAIYKDSERIKNFVEGRLKEFQEVCMYFSIDSLFRITH